MKNDEMNNAADLLLALPCPLPVIPFLTMHSHNFYLRSYFMLLMFPNSIFLAITLFLEAFIRWFNGLTLVDFVLIFWPLITIDFVRSVGKSIFLLVHALYKKINPPRFDHDFLPKVSLIIPAHNEEKIIVRSIESALETNYENKEIIVVDDGSMDRTYQLTYPYAKRGLIKLIHRDVASGSKAGALNYGLLFASGEVIVTIDADTLIERNSLNYPGLKPWGLCYELG